MPSNIEEIINRAMQNGEFDDLSGMGKPLDLREDAHSDPTFRMAHRIMQEHDITPSWIAQRKEIEQKRDAALQKLAQAWRWRQSAKSSDYSNADQYWQRIHHETTLTLEKLNKQIFDYNLSTKIMSQHLRKIDLEREVQKIMSK